MIVTTASDVPALAARNPTRPRSGLSRRRHGVAAVIASPAPSAFAVARTVLGLEYGLGVSTYDVILAAGVRHFSSPNPVVALTGITATLGAILGLVVPRNLRRTDQM